MFGVGGKYHGVWGWVWEEGDSVTQSTPGRLCAKAVLTDGQREMGEACGDEGLTAGLCQAAGPRSLGRG